MGTIELRTELDCLCERVFALSLDLDLELRATAAPADQQATP
ncbi:MAG: hypothetical protein ACRDSZ_14615 [Pseudonocardiaceae bacterium]